MSVCSDLSLVWSCSIRSQFQHVMILIPRWTKNQEHIASFGCSTLSGALKIDIGFCVHRETFVAKGVPITKPSLISLQKLPLQAAPSVSLQLARKMVSRYQKVKCAWVCGSRLRNEVVGNGDTGKFRPAKTNHCIFQNFHSVWKLKASIGILFHPKPVSLA